MTCPQDAKDKAILWSSNLTCGDLSEKHGNVNTESYTHPSVDYNTIYNSQCNGSTPEELIG